MADDVVIRAEGLGKKYLIGHTADRERHVTLRDALARGVRNSWRKTADMARGRAILAGDTVEELWALRDIGFEVKRGDVLGIIGPNGAGKSTLLKILSRITEPTEGRVTIKGRVASLLEVGTGFHPELTGRENTYLNGAILGMTHAEIRKKFDEIIAFAEIEKFVDTPVKRYSSGMYVRLAFAVAAHLQPEILIVDEVLAVGDVEFQRKCLGKISAVAREDRTVLFVSHNLSAVRSLTQDSILLERGRISASGKTGSVLAAFLSKTFDAKTGPLPSPDLSRFRRSKEDCAPAEIVEICINGVARHRDGTPQARLGAKLTIEVRIVAHRALSAAGLTVIVRNALGEPVTSIASWDKRSGFSFSPGEHIIHLHAADMKLAPGRYFADVGLDFVIGASACDVIYNYPLICVLADEDPRWPARPWGGAYCEDVQWSAREVGQLDDPDRTLADNRKSEEHGSSNKFEEST